MKNSITLNSFLFLLALKSTVFASSDHDWFLNVENTSSFANPTIGGAVRYGYENWFFDIGSSMEYLNYKIEKEFRGSYDSKKEVYFNTPYTQNTSYLGWLHLGAGYRKNYFGLFELRYSVKLKNGTFELVESNEIEENLLEVDFQEFNFTNEIKSSLIQDFPLTMYFFQRSLIGYSPSKYIETNTQFLNFGAGVEYNFYGNWSSSQISKEISIPPQRYAEIDLGFSLGSHPTQIHLNTTLSLIPYTFFKWGVGGWSKTASNVNGPKVYVNQSPSKDEGGDQFIMAGGQAPIDKLGFDLIRFGVGYIFEGFASGYRFEGSENSSDGVTWDGYLFQLQFAYALTHYTPINLDLSFYNRQFHSIYEEFEGQTPINLSSNEFRIGVSFGLGYYK